MTTRLCMYCGELPERHEGRCRSVVFRKGEVRRCLKRTQHSGMCDYRGLTKKVNGASDTQRED